MSNLLRAAAAISLTAAAGAAVAVPASAASAATQPPARAAASAPTRYAGVWLPYKGGRYWMGSVRTVEDGRDVIADCVTPGAALLQPTTVTTGEIGTPQQSGEVSYIMARWGASSDGLTAAGARYALWQVLHRSLPGLRISSAVARTAAADLSAAREYAGPYQPAVTFAGKPGKTGTFRVTAVSASGHEVAGLPAHLSVTGAKAAASTRTGDVVRFTRTGLGPVHVTATAESPGNQVTIGTAAHGQTLLTAAGPAEKSASGRLEALPAPVVVTGKATAKATVTCNCHKGTATVNETITQGANSAEGTYRVLVSGHTYGKPVVLPAGNKTQSVVVTVTASNGAVVTVTASFDISGRQTSPAQLGSVTVKCAAPAPVKPPCPNDGKATATAKATA